ncbi:MAG: hypothetical protein JNK05_22175 [Myxococcales bacterium]|nr:hypothetical protein [Myxococcales bacterium]
MDASELPESTRIRERLRALTRDDAVELIDLHDESMRRVRVETAVEFRTITRVHAKDPGTPIDQPRDLERVLWDVALAPEDPFVDEPRAQLDEPKSGEVTDCPTCLGKGEAPCHKCGGTTRVNCDSCRGHGFVDQGRKGSSICKFCQGQKFQPCRTCKVGTLPCKPCGESGRAYTMQRLVVKWLTRKESRVVAVAPPEVSVQDVPFVAERVVRSERGALSPEQLTELDAPLRAAVDALLTEHPTPEGSRIKTQTLIVERTPVFAARFKTRGKEKSAFFVGEALDAVGLEAAVPTSTYVLVAAVLVVGAVTALVAAGIFR